MSRSITKPQSTGSRLFDGRYRLFYRYDLAAGIIVYASVNDENSLRSYGKKSDAYGVFGKMLEGGSPPDDWEDLLNEAGTEEPPGGSGGSSWRKWLRVRISIRSSVTS
ncbi:MAG: hypothetical protein EA422_00485 [Gemmatimonadales bacterium]|nr:MAG: hypothetical protein EA422_00485 [Gemmatimonadales bacterium]